MKINLFRCAFLATALVLMGASATAWAQESRLDGLYCHKANVEFSAPLNPQGKCDPPMAKVDNYNLCRGTLKNNQTLHLRPNKDGSLEFGVSVWQDGYNCGLAGRALKTGNNAWRLEKFINDPDPHARCRLDITVSAGNVLTLRTDPKASCRYACGAGIGFDGVQFPLNSSRVGPSDDLLFKAEESIITARICPL